MPRGKPNGNGRNSVKLTLAYGANGEIVHISKVRNGRKCACTCPACGGALIAKQGKVREHHFAHASGDECPHAVETALHLAAKDILAVRKELVLPAIKIPSHYMRLDSESYMDEHSPELVPQRRYCIESVTVEKRLGSITPDLIIKISGREILVEVTVTHGVSKDKLRKIRNLGLSCLEIDLSDLDRSPSCEELKEVIVDGITHKRWLYNVYAEKRGRNMLSEAILLFKVPQSIPLRVEGCPVSTKMDCKGISYAYINFHCKKCDYLLNTNRNIGVICNGFRVLGKPPPPQKLGIRVPPEAFEHPEEKNSMRALGRWLNKQVRVSWLQ